ncbi:MAG: hypothetical protein JXM73_13915 [Anaerolineae bacterium]|nr:hypothetical protein [Anaerolineae bacterium]
MGANSNNGKDEDFVVIRFKLSGRDPKQARLVELVRQDMESGINISAVLRELLAEYYEYRYKTGLKSIPRFAENGSAAPVAYLQQPQRAEADEDLNDELVQKLLGLSSKFKESGQ